MGRISDDELRRLVNELGANRLKAEKGAGQVKSRKELVADVYGIGPNCDSLNEMTELFALSPALAAEVLQLRETLSRFKEALEQIADGHPKDYSDNWLIAGAALSADAMKREGR